MEEKAVLYIGGGAMSGVFGAGVVTKLQEEDVYCKFSHAYGESSGAWDIAYWLSKETWKGSSIYYEDLTNGFIDFSTALSRIINPANSPNVVNIDLLVNVAKTSKILDVERLKQNPIEAKVKVYNLKRKQIEYVDLKGNPIQRLKEAASVAPWYFCEGQENIDGGVLQSLGYDFIRTTHPESKLVFVINYPFKTPLLKKFRSILEGKVASRMFNDSQLEIMLSDKAKHLEEEAEKIFHDKKALLIFPPSTNQTSNTTTNPEKLRHTHHLGMVEAEKILDFLKG